MQTKCIAGSEHYKIQKNRLVIKSSTRWSNIRIYRK